MDLLQYIKDIFSSGSSSADPYIHEVISRSEEEIAAYEKWKQSARMEHALQFLRLEYKKNKMLENEPGATFYTIKSPSTKGFQLHYHPHFFTTPEFQHLFDHFKEKVLSAGYKIYTSDIKILNKEDHSVTIQRHYLKPPYKKDPDDRLIHLFGNITIQLHLLNDRPDHIKFIANSYSDRKYTTPEDFQELMKVILR